MKEIKFKFNKNIKVRRVSQKDKSKYYDVKKECCFNAVEKYFGGWDNEKQLEYNNRVFEESLEQNYFRKIILNKEIIGFLGFSIFEKEIGCVTVQIKNVDHRKQIFSHFLSYLIELSNELMLPIYAKTFLDSDDIEIYKQAGFDIISTTQSHYNLKRTGRIMERKEYEEKVKEKFDGTVQTLMLEQIDNFYELSKEEFNKKKKYKLNDSVLLREYNLMTGFKLDMDYLKQVAVEGKICGDYAGIETRSGVKWAVSTWKFDKKIKLKDYVNKYSGMTVVYEGKYEIVPYGKLDAFVEKMKKENHFLWEAESTREMRFLPNDIRDNGNIALIFNMGHDACKKLLKNELQQDFMPEEIRLAPNPNERNKSRLAMEKGFGKRCAYVLFGIPRNCIEGLFVDRKTEKSKSQLKQLKKLFPECYICNIDGKVIVE